MQIILVCDGLLLFLTELSLIIIITVPVTTESSEKWCTASSSRGIVKKKTKLWTHLAWNKLK